MVESMERRIHFLPGFIILVVLVTFLAADGAAQPVSGTVFPDASKNIIEPDTITQSQEAILMDMLNSSLSSIADKDRRGRMIGGYTLLGLGAGSLIGGAVTLAVADNDDARIVGYSLMGGGVLLGGLSLVPFKVKSDAERLYADFRRDLRENEGENSQRYYYWDRRFEELANQIKRERLIGGAISIAAGAVASFAVIEGTDQDRFHTFFWPAVGGVASILIKSEAERRYESYTRAKEDILAQQAGAEIQIGFIPLPEGGIVSTVQVRF
jgi:MFS family permease